MREPRSDPARGTVVADLGGTGRPTGVSEVTGETDVVAVGTFGDTDEMNGHIRDLLTHEHVRSVQTDVDLETVREYDHPPVTPPE